MTEELEIIIPEYVEIALTRVAEKVGMSLEDIFQSRKI